MGGTSQRLNQIIILELCYQTVKWVILPSEHVFGIKHIILNNIYDLDPHLEISRILQGMNFWKSRNGD